MIQVALFLIVYIYIYSIFIHLRVKSLQAIYKMSTSNSNSKDIFRISSNKILAQFDLDFITTGARAQHLDPVSYTEFCCRILTLLHPEDINNTRFA